MEITLLPKAGLRIKGKQATIAIDPQDKAAYDATLLMSKAPAEIVKPEDGILILGAGEYETGGLKMSGIRSEADMLYSCHVDGVDVLVGKLAILEKMQHKLKEHNIAVVLCDIVGNASFVTSLAANVVLFYGEKASEIASSLVKENLKQMNKYSSTKDKLPAEVETIVLA